MTEDKEKQIRNEVTNRFTKAFRCDFVPVLQNIEDALNILTVDNLDEQKAVIAKNISRGKGILKTIEKFNNFWDTHPNFDIKDLKSDKKGE